MFESDLGWSGKRTLKRRSGIQIERENNSGHGNAPMLYFFGWFGIKLLLYLIFILVEVQTSNTLFIELGSVGVGYRL